MRSVVRASRRRPPSVRILGQGLAGFVLTLGWLLFLTVRQWNGGGASVLTRIVLGLGTLLSILLLAERASTLWRALHRQQWLRDQARHQARRLESTRILIGGLAHDFNNILAVILGNVSVSRAELEGRCDEWLEPAERAVLRGRDLARQLLAFSKTGVPVRKGTDIGALVRETARFFLSGSQSRCEVALPDGEALWPVRVDPDEMSQVIENLIANADQAMPQGGLIRIGCQNVPPSQGDWLVPPRPGRQVRVTVEDHGVGIPQDQLQKIFEPYFTTKPDGNGLGLATIHAIVHKYGGSISVESSPGNGTSFSLWLPAGEEEKLPKNP